MVAKIDDFDWEELARERGFKYDVKKMLETMSLELTLKDLASNLKMSSSTVRSKMNSLGIVVHSKKGRLL